MFPELLSPHVSGGAQVHTLRACCSVKSQLEAAKHFGGRAGWGESFGEASNGWSGLHTAMTTPLKHRGTGMKTCRTVFIACIVGHPVRLGQYKWIIITGDGPHVSQFGGLARLDWKAVGEPVHKGEREQVKALQLPYRDLLYFQQ
jgi:hypothetical protein